MLPAKRQGSVRQVVDLKAEFQGLEGLEHRFQNHSIHLDFLTSENVIQNQRIFEHLTANNHQLLLHDQSC